MKKTPKKIPTPKKLQRKAIAWIIKEVTNQMQRLPLPPIHYTTFATGDVLSAVVRKLEKRGWAVKKVPSKIKEGKIDLIITVATEANEEEKEN